MRRPQNARRGGALVEFTLVALLLCVMLLAGIEFDRLVLVYTTMADCARSGLRYAVVHGALKNGSGVDGPSGPGNTAQIETVVRNFSGAGMLDTGRLQVSVTYPDGNNQVGSRVRIQVSYAYDPFTRLPLGIPLGSQTEGIITF